MITDKLLAGAGMADITPEKGIQIAGSIGLYRPVEEIRDPIYAHALVLQVNEKKVCILSLDLLAITRKWADEIRQQACARFGFEPDAVMVHVVQNHAAPSLGHSFVWETDEFNLFPKEHPWLLGGDDRYNPVVLAGALKAIEKASVSLQPVQVMVGRGVDGRVAFNRRFVLRNGTVKTHPANCQSDILYCEGPVDPEVGVVTFTTKNGSIVAMLLHHTCHPTHGYPQRWISGGWPGAWAHEIQKRYGQECIPIVLNGFCGNIHHYNHLDPNFKDDYLEMGRKLAWTTEQVIKKGMKAVEPLFLEWQTKWMRIPLRRPTESELAEARQMLKEHPEPVWKNDGDKTAATWDWVYAACQLDLVAHIERDPFFDYYVQVFRLGNIGIPAVPGEPFVEEQLRIKLKSPASFTFCAHMSNEYVGYIPTEEAFQRGGYETRTCNGSKLAPDALRTIGDCILELLKQLFHNTEKQNERNK